MARIVRYRDGRGRHHYGGLSADGTRIHEFPGGLYGDRRPGPSRPAAEAHVVAPVEPSKILAVGHSHPAARQAPNGTCRSEPLIFHKTPNTVTGPQAPIVCPPGTDTVDVSGELAVVIGRRARHLTESEALDYVLGYTCANDVGVRAWMDRDSQWFRAKSTDTFCPLGPWITPPHGRDPHTLRITVAVNGTVELDGSTAELAWTIPQVLAYITRYATLEPGDTVLMGSPSGLATATCGDTVAVTVEGIGTLVNTVVAHSARRAA